jgi:uncharacterized protein YbjT (DUF2867 family)
MAQRVAITGATGRQGGAVARLMLRNGWNVRAITGDPRSGQALALADLGAELIEANLVTQSDLVRAFVDCNGVFGVTDFWEHGLKREVDQGANIVAAARTAGVSHLVFSSIGAADRVTGLGLKHFDSKKMIEDKVKMSGMCCTILRSVTFFENFRTPRYLRSIVHGRTLRFGFVAAKTFQFVAVEDLAHFAGLAFDGDDRVFGRTLDIASDAIKMEDLAAALSKATDQSIKYRCLSPLQLRLISMLISISGGPSDYRAGPSLIPQFAWNNEDENGGWAADLDLLRKIHPRLTTMQQWVDQFNWRQADNPKRIL